MCRVMDYSKYKYEQEQKAKLARKHQSTITIKEIKLRPKIDPHDYATKKGHVGRFLKNRDKVKVTIMFRGREMTHPERGRALLLKLAEEVKELGIIESEPLQDGRNMVMMLAPHKNPVKDRPGGTSRPASAPPRRPEAGARSRGRGAGGDAGRGRRRPAARSPPPRLRPRADAAPAGARQPRRRPSPPTQTQE